MTTPKLESLLLLGPAQDLPRCPVSPIVQEALELLGAPNVDPRELAGSIVCDPELAEHLATAIAQQTGRRVPDVWQGIRLIGLKSFERLLMQTASAYERSELEVALEGLMQGELLDHSYQVGLCSYLIAVETGFCPPSEAYAAGWLHDLGLALLEAFPCEELATALGASLTEAKSMLTTEDAILEGNHAYLGAKLLERWQVAPGIVAAVANHHAPREALTGQRLTRIVQLAEAGVSCQLARAQEGGGGQIIDEAALASLGLAPERLFQLALRAIEHHARHQGYATVSLA